MANRKCVARGAATMVLALGVMGACGESGPATGATASGPAAATRNDEFSAEVGAAPALAMTIENVRQDQRLIEKAPWFEKGGDWVVFDCLLTRGRKRGVFTIGMSAIDGRNERFRFGKVRLVAGDRAAGTVILSAICKALGEKEPVARKPTELVPRDCGAAILGEGLARGKTGGFSGRGDWTATKLFLDDDTEVYFNFNLASREAEFSEKDTDYRANVVDAMAEVLRDGPRPVRTVADDPSMSATGPTIGALDSIAVREGTDTHFCGGRLLISEPDEKGSSLVALDPARLSQRETWALLRGGVVSVAMAGGKRFVVTERVAKNARVFSLDDAKQVWTFDRPGAAGRKLEGEWGDAGQLAGDEAVSPAGRIVAIKGEKKKEGASEAKSMLWFVDLDTGKTLSHVALPQGYVTVARWAGAGAAERLTVQMMEFGEGSPPRSSFTVDPSAGTIIRLKDEPGEVSPGGTRRMVLVEKAKVVVKPAGDSKAREFVFHADDQRYAKTDAVQWVSDDYLELATVGQAFIDVRTMKMSMLGKDRELKTYFRFSPDFRWAVARKEGRLYVGPVKLP